MTLLRCSVLTSCLFAAACGGSSSSGGAVSGTVHGQSFAIEDTISAAVTVNGQHTAAILMASSSGACAQVMADTSHPNEKAVIISLADVNGVTFNTPVAPGMYSIYQGTGQAPAKTATMSFVVQDATCTSIAADAAKATSGSVMLTGVSGNAFTGTYDVALDSGDHVTGSFSPSECPAIQNLFATGAQSVCM